MPKTNMLVRECRMDPEPEHIIYLLSCGAYAGGREERGGGRGSHWNFKVQKK